MALCLAGTFMPAMADDVTVTVTNESTVQRQQLVEVDASAVISRLGIKQGEPFVVMNALGQQVAYQLTYDGKLVP